MEGPKVPSETRRREAPERRGGGVWGVWGSGGYSPQKIFQKINLEIPYFSAFLQAEMVPSAVVERQD